VGVVGVAFGAGANDLTSGRVLWLVRGLESAGNGRKGVERKRLTVNFKSLARLGWLPAAIDEADILLEQGRIFELIVSMSAFHPFLVIRSRTVGAMLEALLTLINEIRSAGRIADDVAALVKDSMAKTVAAARGI
jgi:hypothetical protein